jgi:hypothetical protein
MKSIDFEICCGGTEKLYRRIDGCFNISSCLLYSASAQFEVGLISPKTPVLTILIYMKQEN